MDRREFLSLMASTGAMGTMLPACLSKGGPEPSTNNELASPPDPRLGYLSRPGRELLSPYLVLPKMDYYRREDPIWLNWGGAQWTDFRFGPHGYWFVVPELGETVDVVVPVINLGNQTSHHLVVEIYEGPPLQEMALSACTLIDRRGPLVLHPGRMTGVLLQYTRRRAAGASVAICYDPFFDPRHAIARVGRQATDRKNLGNCPGIMPPVYGV